MALDARKLCNKEAFVFDIEGTICSISFVKEVLYPYFTKALPQYATDHWSEQDFEDLRRDFPLEAQGNPEALIEHCRELVSKDIKDSTLKELQGRIWTSGYANGSYSAPLYPDVLPAFQTIQDAGKLLAIYSSGSVEAQRLLLGHVASDDGPSVDIQCLFKTGSQERLFDTKNAGMKTDRRSYEKIAEALGKGVDSLVFFTDNVLEAKAATEAGVYTIVLVRPGNPSLPAGTHDLYPVVNDLDQLKKIVSQA